MPDVMPDYRVEQQRLKAEIAELKAREESHKLQLLELVSRRDQILHNWEAEREAIAHKEENLKSLSKAHGAVTEELISDAKETDLTAGKVED